MPSGLHGLFIALYLAGHITLTRALTCEGVILLDNILRPFLSISPSEAIEWFVFSQHCLPYVSPYLP